MESTTLALAFIRRFCAGDTDALGELLAADLVFRGPLLACEGRDAYLARLREDPPGMASFVVLAHVGGDGAAAVLWEYRKPAGTVEVAAFFRTSGEAITEIRLVFDPAGAQGARGGN